MIPPTRYTSIRGSPTDRYRSRPTAASDRPPTTRRDGDGGIASCRKTRSGGVLRNWIIDGNAKPTSNTSALPAARITGRKPVAGRSPCRRSARMRASASSARKPTVLPATTPSTPSNSSCTSATEITNPWVAPRLFINATVSMRRWAKRRADIAIATALSNRLITAVSDRNRWARSAALYARSLLSSWLRTRISSGNMSWIASLNAATSSSVPATSSA